MSAKKIRGPNFSKRDKDLLLDLVKPSLHIIECKTTNSANNGDKDKAWNTITENFNAVSDTKRLPDSLRQQYIVIKSAAKKEKAQERVCLLKFLCF